MKALIKLAAVQTKLHLREPMSVFFTLLFGPLLVILMGIIFGNDPQPMFGGRGHLDVSVPAYAAVIIGITGLTTIPITIATRREAGVLRRFAATPLRPLVYYLSDVLAPFVLTLAGVLLLIAAGMLVFQVRFEGQWLSLAAAASLGILSFFSLGYALAGLAPSSRIAIVLGNILIIPMNIFSGALVPIEVMPEGVQQFSRFIPLTHVVRLLQGTWLGQAWGAHLLEVGVLAGILLAGMVVVTLTFNWEAG